MSEPAAPEQHVGVLGAVAFLIELVMVALLVVAGWRLGTSAAMSVVLAVVLVATAVVGWSRWMAPLSSRRLPGTARAILATGLFVSTAAVATLAGISPFVTIPFAVIGTSVFVATRNK